MGLDDDGVEVWLRLRNAAGEDVVLRVRASTAIPTLRRLLPDIDWYEREIADMFGVRFGGRDAAPLLLAAGAAPTMRREQLLRARQATPWPGEKDPGGTTPRRRTLPPGVIGGAQ